MNRNDSICSSEFYRDTGFDIIRNWLKDNCLCSLNKDFFTQLTPLIKIQKISDVQDYCNEFLSAFQRKNPLPLETIPNISSWIDSLNISGFQLLPENFRELYQLLILSSTIKQYLIKSDFPLWHVNGKNLIISKLCQTEIEKIFDDSFQIRSDASPELKRLTRSISKAEGSIKDTMQKVFIHAKQENWLGGDQIVFRNGRSVLPLKISRKRKVKGIIQDQSSTGQTAYIEPLEIIELNNKLTELHFSLTEERHRILRELTAFFQPYYNEIQESFNILKYIDQHNTMAKLAYQINAICPEMNENGILKVENAVNPLFSLVEKKSSFLRY